MKARFTYASARAIPALMKHEEDEVEDDEEEEEEEEDDDVDASSQEIIQSQGDQTVVNFNNFIDNYSKRIDGLRTIVKKLSTCIDKIKQRQKELILFYERVKQDRDNFPKESQSFCRKTYNEYTRFYKDRLDMLKIDYDMSIKSVNDIEQIFTRLRNRIAAVHHLETIMNFRCEPGLSICKHLVNSISNSSKELDRILIDTYKTVAPLVDEHMEDLLADDAPKMIVYDPQRQKERVREDMPTYEEEDEEDAEEDQGSEEKEDGVEKAATLKEEEPVVTDESKKK
jgi:hypothetical protein